jgi:hypothetical protein
MNIDFSSAKVALMRPPDIKSPKRIPFGNGNYTPVAVAKQDSTFVKNTL